MPYVLNNETGPGMSESKSTCQCPIETKYLKRLQKHATKQYYAKYVRKMFPLNVQ